MISEADFAQFVAARLEDLKRIARHTHGEHDVGDVQSEAWLMAAGWQAVRGASLDLSTQDGQQLLLSHLYQHLVRYTELQVRHAVRLDHAPRGSEDTDSPHPLLNQLSSDDGMEPLSILLAAERESDATPTPDQHHSPAAAWACLLSHFDNRMLAVARHLMISLSHSYRCCRRARQLAYTQPPLPVAVVGAEDFIPGPWRRNRHTRDCRQLAFDFDEPLPLGW
jgi:hypothetical protein